MSMQDTANQATMLQKQYSTGAISAEEFKELINDLGVVQAIQDESANLEENLQYREIILNVINIASALA